jgi:hypothetical protein
MRSAKPPTRADFIGSSSTTRRIAAAQRYRPTVTGGRCVARAEAPRSHIDSAGRNN